MYLERSVYVGAYFEHRKVTGMVDITVYTDTKDERKIDVGLSKISSITEQVGYWRKANAIHNWFIQECADGDEGATRVYVPKEKLKELYNLCDLVLKGSITEDGRLHAGTRYTGDKVEEVYEDGKVIVNKELAESLLPTTDGFFFGSTDYNEWYLQDLKDTMEILAPILALEDDEGEYYYIASW
jgi:hypothetical protein